jgi:RNA polymerase sigma factor (sigma-70 family)
VDGEAMIGDPRGEARATGFPEKANPNRRVLAANDSWRETRGEARSFSRRCNPRHARGPLTDEQRELATRYMPLARAIALEVLNKTMRYDELEAEAFAALVEAARGFDPGQGVDFSVYARPRIVGALRDYRRFLLYRAWEVRSSKKPEFERMRTVEVRQGWIVGKEPDRPVGQQAELSEALASVLGRLPPPEATACRLLYLEGKSGAETAHALNCTEGHVSRLRGEALEHIRRVYAKALVG